MKKVVEELKRHGVFKFELIFMVMDPGYNKENLNKIKENLQLLNIKAHIFKTDIFEISSKLDNENPCYMCAKMRRGYLYSEAKKLGCNKIALGHHFDDVIETILLSVFYGGEYKSMPPKLWSSNFSGMELIRPLYLVREDAIVRWAKYNDLKFINCACKFTDSSKTDSKRLEMKYLIRNLEKKNPNVGANIFKSSENVNIETVLGIRVDGKKVSFLDNYAVKKGKNN